MQPKKPDAAPQPQAEAAEVQKDTDELKTLEARLATLEQENARLRAEASAGKSRLVAPPTGSMVRIRANQMIRLGPTGDSPHIQPGEVVDVPVAVAEEFCDRSFATGYAHAGFAEGGLIPHRIVRRAERVSAATAVTRQLD